MNPRASIAAQGPSKLSSSKQYRLVISAVHMVYRLVNSTYTVEELTLRLTRLLCQFIQASSASIYLVDPVKKHIVACASFDNQINIWRNKPKELKAMDPEVLAVTRGATVTEGNCIGLPLIADDYLGAIFLRRHKPELPFNSFDRELLSVFAEQVVTAIKNLELNHAHEQIVLGSMATIGGLLKKQSHQGLTHAPAFMAVVSMLAIHLKVSREGIKQLEYAGMLHDIGVIDVPFEILSKQGQLSADEFKIIRRHTAHSVALIKPVAFLKPVLPIILYHHEKYDGSGYPSGLKKEQIPLGARILAVVDAFEAMIQGRPYRIPLTIPAALDELIKQRGSQFDPKVVDVFHHLYDQRKFRKLLFLLKG